MTTITIDRALLEQALGALMKSHTCPLLPDDCENAIAALRAALAQQADPTDPGHDVDVLREHVRHLERRIRELHAQQAEPVQEPVAWMTPGQDLHLDNGEGFRFSDWTPLCKCADTPPQRKPLTEEEIRDLWSWAITAEAERTATTQQHAFARAIERAHGIGGQDER